MKMLLADPEIIHEIPDGKTSWFSLTVYVSQRSEDSHREVSALGLSSQEPNPIAP